MANPICDMYVMSLTNSNEGGVLNIAQFGIEIHSAEATPVPQVAAQIIAYPVKCRANFLASGTLITRLQLRAAGTGGFVDVVFPDSEYNDLVANDAGLAEMHDYGDTVLGASGGLAPVGTSVCMTERTDDFGRSGRGRHFLPFVNKAKVDGAGLFNESDREACEDAYRDYIIDGNLTFGSVSLNAVVQNAAHTTQKPIVAIEAQAVLSNLRSRRR